MIKAVDDVMSYHYVGCTSKGKLVPLRLQMQRLLEDSMYNFPRFEPRIAISEYTCLANSAHYALP